MIEKDHYVRLLHTLHILQNVEIPFSLKNYRLFERIFLIDGIFAIIFIQQ
jgi:hypothetical protein